MKHDQVLLVPQQTEWCGHIVFCLVESVPFAFHGPIEVASREPLKDVHVLCQGPLRFLEIKVFNIDEGVHIQSQHLNQTQVIVSSLFDTCFE